MEIPDLFFCKLDTTVHIITCATNTHIDRDCSCREVSLGLDHRRQIIAAPEVQKSKLQTSINSLMLASAS